MAKKKAKSAKSAKKATQKKAKPAKRIARAKGAPKKKVAAKKKAAPSAKKVKRAKAAPPKPKRAKTPPSRAYHVRIDHVTQGYDGHEVPADRLSIRSDDFLWIYVEADLPSGGAPQGEYSKVVGGNPTNPQPLGPPEDINGQYRYSVIHYVLSPASKYLFRFADNLAAPTYKDQWEIVTV